MFNICDFVAKNQDHEEIDNVGTTPEEKLDEIQLLEQAQSRLPAFCPHSSPSFEVSCRSILSGFEWYAESPLMGIDEPELLQARPSADFAATSTVDHGSRPSDLLKTSAGPEPTLETSMHGPSVRQLENRHQSRDHELGSPPPSPTFSSSNLVDTMPRISSAELMGDVATSSEAMRLSSLDKNIMPQSSNLPIEGATDSCGQACIITNTHCHEHASSSANDDDERSLTLESRNQYNGEDSYDDDSDDDSRSYDSDSDSDSEAEEEPHLSPRLVDARVLYEMFLQRRAETGEGSSDSTSDSEGYGFGSDDDGFDYNIFGAWHDLRVLHRRNEDFPYHNYKPPLVGDEFQAVLPELLTKEARSALVQPIHSTTEVDDDGPREEELIWSPDSISEDKVNEYLDLVKGTLDASDYSEEKALTSLHRNGYDTSGTLAALILDPQPFIKDRWSDTEQAALITGWRLYWKNWRKIQTMMPGRSTAEFMQFYYQHKSRADHLYQEQRMHEGYYDSSEDEENQELPGGLPGDKPHSSDALRTEEAMLSSSPSSSGVSSPQLPTVSPPPSPLSVYISMGEDESDNETDRSRKRPRLPSELESDSPYASFSNLQKKRRRDEDDSSVSDSRAGNPAKSEIGEERIAGLEGNDASEEDEKRSQDEWEEVRAGKRARVEHASLFSEANYAEDEEALPRGGESAERLLP